MREMCPYLEFFCAYFPAFGLNTEIYFVIRARKTPNSDTFYTVRFWLLLELLELQIIRLLELVFVELLDLRFLEFRITHAELLIRANGITIGVRIKIRDI